MPTLRFTALLCLLLAPYADAADDAPAPVAAPVAPEAPPAEEAPPAPQAPPFGIEQAPPLDLPEPIAEEEYETIVVISDPFSRWDGTRWFIKTEVVLPIPMTFFADENYEFRTHAFQVRTILACEKDWKLGKKTWEVSCKLEDFGIQAAAFEDPKRKKEAQDTRNQKIQAILDEVDQKLTGASLQLQVGASGRVNNIDLEGVAKGNSKQAGMAETLRLVLSRVIIGFDMKLKDYNFLEQGLWTEYNPKLMSMPYIQATYDVNGRFQGVDTEPSMGNSMLVHKLHTVEKNLVVETRGKGVISLPSQLQPDQRDNWMTDFAGVAVYSEQDAYMTERVWILRGTPTAATWMNNEYRHAGRIVQLDPEQVPSCGETQQVAMPGAPVTGVPAWIPIED